MPNDFAQTGSEPTSAPDQGRGMGMGSDETSTMSSQPDAGISNGQEQTPLTLGAQPQPAQDSIDWKKDERYGKRWKTENDVYKSYRELETNVIPQYTTLKKSAEQRKQMLQKYQMEEDHLPSVLEDYAQIRQVFESKDHPLSKFVNLANDPIYGQQLLSALQELEIRKLQESNPTLAGMTREQLNEYKKYQERVEAFEADRKAEEERKKTEAAEQKYQEDLKKNNAHLDDGFKKIDALVAERGFQFTPEMRLKFIDECMNAEIPPNLMYYKFLEAFGGELDKSYAKKIELQTIKKAQNNRDTVVFGPTNATNANPGVSNKSVYMGGLKEIFLGKHHK